MDDHINTSKCIFTYDQEADGVQHILTLRERKDKDTGLYKTGITVTIRHIKTDQRKLAVSIYFNGRYFIRIRDHIKEFGDSLYSAIKFVREMQGIEECVALY